MKFPLFLPFQPLVAFQFSCIFTSWRMKAVGFCPEGVVQRSHVRKSWKYNLDELFFPIVYGICYRVLWLITSLKFQNNVKRYLILSFSFSPSLWSQEDFKLSLSELGIPITNRFTQPLFLWIIKILRNVEWTILTTRIFRSKDHSKFFMGPAKDPEHRK